MSQSSLEFNSAVQATSQVLSALQRAREAYQALLGQCYSYFFVLDEDLRIIYANTPSRNLLRNKPIGEPISHFLPNSWVKKIQAWTAQNFSTTFDFECTHIMKQSHTQILWKMAKSTLHNGSGDLPVFLLSGNDISSLSAIRKSAALSNQIQHLYDLTSSLLDKPDLASALAEFEKAVRGSLELDTNISFDYLIHPNTNKRTELKSLEELTNFRHPEDDEVNHIMDLSINESIKSHLQEHDYDLYCLLNDGQYDRGVVKIRLPKERVISEEKHYFLVTACQSMAARMASHYFNELSALEGQREAEREVVKLMQLNLTSKVFHHSWQIKTHYEPAELAGGDWFGTYTDGQGGSYLCLADVSGHGIPSALITGIIAGSCASVFSDIRGLSKVRMRDLLHLISEGFYHKFSSRYSASMQIYHFGADRTITIVNAGHPLPIKISPRVKRGFSYIKGAGALLGVSTEPKLEFHQIQLEFDESILMYTDGVIENRFPDDYTRAMQEFNRNLRKYAKDSDFDALIESCSNHEPHGVELDDTTLITVRPIDLHTLNKVTS